MKSQKNPKTLTQKHQKIQKNLPKQFSVDVSPNKQPTLSKSISKPKKQSQKQSVSRGTHQTNKKSIISSDKLQKKNQKQQFLAAITKDNYDIMDQKFNITDIKQLEVKYCLRCIEGIFKNRSIYITTHKQGQIFGSGQAKQYGLTLQIDGVGLQKKHCKLKFSGFKKFFVKDYGTLSGTWVNISQNGIKIKHGDVYIIGPFNVRFEIGRPIDQIQQICIVHQCNQLSERLKYNSLTSLKQIYQEQYSNNFKQYPFSEQQIALIKNISAESKSWYDENQKYNRLQMHLMNTDSEMFGFSIQIGWEKFYFPQQKQLLLFHTLGNTEEDYHRKQQQSIAYVNKGKLHPPPNKSKANAANKVFTKIQAQKYHQLFLHDQIKIGNLLFELTRFNYGAGQNIGFRQRMEDCLIIEQDIGGSEWKLISLFAVFDGYGGDSCINFIKKKLIRKIRQWTPFLDQAGDLNQMLKLLMFKTFYEIDFQYHQSEPQVSMTCGATGLLLLVIDSKAYVFNLGDNKGLLYRKDKLFQLSIDHIPSRIDQKNRIQQQGGYIQYDRLMGKCTLSRAFGQFEYKNIEDYKRNMKGKLKSLISCQPESICFDIDPTIDDFIVLSTDGIIDTLGIQTMTNYITEKAMLLDEDQNPYKIVNSLMENAKLIDNKNCDNMAVILIFIGKGKIGAKSAW